MRVVSLVPSLTETLIEFGVNVVGRTRFCIHPVDKVQEICRVGGTKGVDWTRVAALNPDMVVFDKEENIKSMVEECSFPWMATHFESIESCPRECEKLARVLGAPQLLELAERWQSVVDHSVKASVDWQNIPGAQAKIGHEPKKICRLEYMIWRDPWMAVASNTFIGSVLAKLGFGNFLPQHTSKYPQLNEQELCKETTFFLFSSEPYPFNRHQKYLQEAGFNGAIVDGELYSWFGIRSLRALEQVLYN